ncbi:hypothetical protein V2J09_017966 [Rumex salicifolius]
MALLLAVTHRASFQTPPPASSSAGVGSDLGGDAALPGASAMVVVDVVAGASWSDLAVVDTGSIGDSGGGEGGSAGGAASGSGGDAVPTSLKVSIGHKFWGGAPRLKM